MENGFEVYNVMSFNLMRDERCETPLYPHLNWVNRQPLVMETIRMMMPDILAIQEANDLPNAPFINFAHLLTELGYSGSFHHYAKNPKLRVATFWKYSKFRSLGANTFWLKQPMFLTTKTKNSTTAAATTAASAPNHKTMALPRPLGFDFLIPVSNNPLLLSRPIRVYNTHFGHSYAEKEQNIKDVLRIMHDNSLHNIDNPSILMLDGNFFTQSGGLDLRRSLCNYHNLYYRLDDLTFYARPSSTMITNSSTSDKVHGTFVGSAIDTYTLPPGTIGDALDCIAGHNVHLHFAYVVDNIPITSNWMKRNEMKLKSKVDLTNDCYGSDHLPLFVTISW